MNIKDRLYSVVSGFVFSLSFFLFRYDICRSATRRGRIQEIMEEPVH